MERTTSPRGPALSVSAKIFVIAASFSLPIAVLVWLMVSNINSQIHFSTLELAGNAYQRSLETLLQSIQQSWLETSGCGGCKPRPETTAQVATSLESLHKVQREYGGQLQFTPEGLRIRNRQSVQPEAVAERWQAVQADSDGQAQIIRDVRTMITHAGDTSNLILDPDLDSYYLMDVTLLALPQLQDRLGQVIAQGRAILSGPPASASQRIRMATLLSHLKESDMARIAASTETAINEDANFHGSSPHMKEHLAAGLAQLHAAVDPFLAMVEELASSDHPSVSGEAFGAAGQAALQASYNYWNVAVPELDVLLHTRVADDRAFRTHSLLWAGLALAVALLLSVYFMRSITGPLDGLVRSLGPGATLLASSVERIAENSRNPEATHEEAEIICDELNAHTVRMRAAVLELARHVQGSDAESRLKAATGELVS